MKSEICIYDITSGAVSVLLQTDRLIEAPNWAPDGSGLVVNGDGRLFSVDLKAPELREIPTGFAVNCNNDHGISPDGGHLVISDKTQHGASCIYTLPFSGGVPVQITEYSPSYWHGWSPDGQTLAYVGKRGDDPFNVFTIAVEGGEETCLTTGFEHTDGPDYTPNGEWIWFNGQRQGKMQLWRIRPDGRDVQQMTDDERWNWFPHPSPDGAHVLYLAYEGDVFGHPRDKEVQLRSIAADGGQPKVLLDLFGGQGSINVPCWAPDGSQFAFVRYARPEA